MAAIEHITRLPATSNRITGWAARSRRLQQTNHHTLTPARTVPPASRWWNPDEFYPSRLVCHYWLPPWLAFQSGTGKP